jgi:hypothetical protein
MIDVIYKVEIGKIREHNGETHDRILHIPFFYHPTLHLIILVVSIDKELRLQLSMYRITSQYDFALFYAYLLFLLIKSAAACVKY